MIVVLDDHDGKLAKRNIDISKAKVNKKSNDKKPKKRRKFPSNLIYSVIGFITFLLFCSILSNFLTKRHSSENIVISLEEDITEHEDLQVVVLDQNNLRQEQLKQQKKDKLKNKEALKQPPPNIKSESNWAVGGILHEIEAEIEHILHIDNEEDSMFNTPEWNTLINQVIPNHPDGKRFLIGWPTIPVSHKGADSRAIDTITFLNKIGFQVDLIYWRDYASELSKSWDDTPDRERLYKAGVHRILGPYSQSKLSNSHTFVSSYFAFIFWLWPDGPYLECVHDFVNHILKQNSLTRIIPVVDDTGIALRNLYASRKNLETTTEEVEEFLLQMKRHPDLLGREASRNSHGATTKLTNDDFISMRSPVYLFHLEMYLYVLADATVGLNSHIQGYLQKMVPGTPSFTLSYISPIQPKQKSDGVKSFHDRKSDYIFFGYNNIANRAAIDWFMTNVFEQLSPKYTFHIVGVVTYFLPEYCKCVQSQKNSFKCTSVQHANIICHGDLPDTKLENLIRSVRVAINPVLEPSGVATKTCRALAYGTPVVVSALDGTFDGDIHKTTHAAIRCNVKEDSSCFVRAIQNFLINENDWIEASNEATNFITQNYGSDPFTNDWFKILQHLYSRKIEILLDGDAKQRGQSMAQQNWYIAKMLQNNNDFIEVTVLGELDPPIHGVKRIDPPTYGKVMLNEDEAAGLGKKYEITPSPFDTGFQAHMILRQKWPPSVQDNISLAYCGVKCRIVQILPWEFGSLPRAWVELLWRNVDFIAGPSEYNRRIFVNSGIGRDRTLVMPAGVDCTSLQAVERKKNTEQPVTFVFTGGLLPRKGIDVMLEEFSNVFCSSESSHNVKLIIHTSYELGYSLKELAHFEELASSCNNKIELIRNTWMDDTKHKELIRSGDIYLAPFRSEGFGLPIVEALVMGLAVVVSTGGTAADAFVAAIESDEQHHFTEENRQFIYPVSSKEVPCTHEPCRRNKQLCLFPPCWDSGKNVWKCTCEKLVDTPTWFEADRQELQKQMLASYQDIIKSRGAAEDAPKNDGILEFCWNSLTRTYHNRITSTLKSPLVRHDIQKYFFVEPDAYRLKEVRRIRRMRKRIFTISVIAVIILVIAGISYFWNSIVDAKTKASIVLMLANIGRMMYQNPVMRVLKRIHLLFLRNFSKISNKRRVIPLHESNDFNDDKNE